VSGVVKSGIYEDLVERGVVYGCGFQELLNELNDDTHTEHVAWTLRLASLF
jgi:hypothetical protein